MDIAARCRDRGRRRVGRRRCPPAVGTRRRGMALIDVLVGLAVAMFTVVVVYQAFVVVQAIRGNASAAADTHGSGTFALFTLATQIANAGAGVASAARWLDSCPDSGDVATSMRPLN